MINNSLGQWFLTGGTPLQGGVNKIPGGASPYADPNVYSFNIPLIIANIVWLLSKSTFRAHVHLLGTWWYSNARKSSAIRNVHRRSNLALEGYTNEINFSINTDISDFFQCNFLRSNGDKVKTLCMEYHF